MRQKALKHEFVEYAPRELEDGTLYVSIKFATAIHNCCCGCGHQVVTPLSPADWTLIFDGRSVSLYPSIGNWSFPCRSHYWIKHNKVIWARQWSREEIKAGRHNDLRAQEHYFSKPELTETALDALQEAAPTPIKKAGFWQRLARMFRTDD